MQKVFENIIKALEEKRDEAEKNMELSDVLSEVNSYGGMFDALDKAIEIINQTAAEYNNGWIPCSEPPKTSDYILLSFSNQTCEECAKEHDQLAEWMEELKQYRAIGTPDGCRAAVEKQKERKPIKYDKMALWAYACPKCGEPLIKTNYEYKYCDMCGQKLDWGDEE